MIIFIIRETFEKHEVENELNVFLSMFCKIHLICLKGRERNLIFFHRDVTTWSRMFRDEEIYVCEQP